MTTPEQKEKIGDGILGLLTPIKLSFLWNMLAQCRGLT